MSDLRFARKLASSPWLCDREHVEFMHEIYVRYLERAASGRPLDRQAVEQEFGRPLGNTREVTVRGGVARIPVEGPIFRRANLFTEVSGGVSVETLMADLNTVMGDPTVRSVLLVFDSPGGELAGVSELAGAIRAARDESGPGGKRIEAYCDGDCASGAYWLASATGRITTDATGILGSIGVVTRVRNPDAAGESGTLEFVNARSPKKRVNPNSPTGAAEIQRTVDDLGDEFIRAVASNRGVSIEAVERDFGEGGVMAGRRAVAAGLADEIGSEEAVIRRLSSSGALGAPRTGRAGYGGAQRHTAAAEREVGTMRGDQRSEDARIADEAEALVERERAAGREMTYERALVEVQRAPAEERPEPASGQESVRIADEAGRLVAHERAAGRPMSYEEALVEVQRPGYRPVRTS